MDVTALISLAAEVGTEVYQLVKQAIDSKNADVLAAATAVMTDALQALKEARAQAVADVEAAFAEAQSEIDKKEGA